MTGSENCCSTLGQAAGMELTILANTGGGGGRGRHTGRKWTKAGSGKQNKQEVKSAHRKEQRLSKPLKPTEPSLMEVLFLDKL